DDELAKLLTRVSSTKEGVEVAVEILLMRFYRSPNESAEVKDSILEYGRKLLGSLSFGHDPADGGSRDYALGVIAGHCLEGEKAKATASSICKRLRKAIEEHKIFSFNYPELTKQIVRRQPEVFLDTFYGTPRGRRSRKR